MALFVLVLGVFSLTIVNYGVTLIFAVITIQQLWDSEIDKYNVETFHSEGTDDQKSQVINENQCDEEKQSNSQPCEETSDDKNKENKENKEDEKCTQDAKKEVTPEDCNVCSENKIYKIFKNLREKFSFNSDV